MEIPLLLKGFIIGFVLSIPIGPVGILCIQRTMGFGKLHGFLSGLSAALSDLVFSIVAAFGITVVSDFISGHLYEIRVLGGVILFVLGYRTLRPQPIKEATNHQVSAPALTFFSTFLVTFTNPMTVFAFATIFAGIGIDNLVNNHVSAILLVAGIFLGSLSWFSLLTVLSSLFKVKILSQKIVLINKITGILLMLIGVIALLSGFGKY